MAPTRRQLLSTAAGIGGFGTVAGCLGTDDGNASDILAQASFFVFGDVASNVAGDAAETGLLVPVGQHGHGWEPGPRVREDIYDARLFFHGMDGFQPWADDVRGDIEDDGADVVTVDVSDGVKLLEAGSDHDHDDDHTDPEDRDEDSHDDEDHGHVDEASADPHFWMDPLRVKRAVTNVQQGLVDIDEGNSETYASNAADYVAKLEALHGRIEALLQRASTDVLLVAGHDSFQYFGDRYGVEVRALTDVSPDDRPTTRDIERAQAVIADHGLQYICADPLESQQAAEQLVAETDAEAVLPLTAMPGLKDEWNQEGWGYLGVMENVNIPTLEEALDT